MFMYRSETYEQHLLLRSRAPGTCHWSRAGAQAGTR
jgi:hypothetical protein